MTASELFFIYGVILVVEVTYQSTRMNATHISSECLLYHACMQSVQIALITDTYSCSLGEAVSHYVLSRGLIPDRMNRRALYYFIILSPS